MAALALLAATLAACPRRVAPPRPAPAPAALDTAAVIAILNERAARVHSLRAHFTAAVTRDGRERSLTGVLIVAAPDRYRFRLMLPLGMTVFDLVRDRAMVATLAPLGGADQALGDGLDWMLLPPRVDARCQVGRAQAMLDIRCGGPAMLVRPGDATIAASSAGGFWTHYGDERVIAGVPLPHRIDIPYPDGTAVRVEVERYDLNPVLPDALFVPPAGASISYPYADGYGF